MHRSESELCALLAKAFDSRRARRLSEDAQGFGSLEDQGMIDCGDRQGRKALEFDGSDAGIVEAGFATTSGVSKAAKVALAEDRREAESLIGG